MANAKVVYRVMIVLFIIVVGIQYFYLNPISKPAAITQSQIKKASLIESLFAFKTVTNGDFNVGDVGDLKSEFSTVKTEFPSSSVSYGNKLISSKINVSVGETISLAPAIPSVVANGSESTSMSTDLKYCPNPPPGLLGFVNVTLEDPPPLTVISRMHSDLELGGRFRPKGCKSKDKVAIVIPFRDREDHLRIFMHNIHPVLKRQMIEYNIFVIEQGGSELFNRAMLFNVGFVEAMKRDNFDCFIFHDVDLIPENDQNIYSCPIMPRHMSVAIDKMNYQLPYKTIFGGISALRTEQFKLLNGFSNVFWGWGAEDDDMANRIAFRGMYISRPSPMVARYRMLKHKHQKLNNNRYKQLLKGKQRFSVDGLSNLNYTVDQIILEKLFTRIRVQLIRVGDG